MLDKLENLFVTGWHQLIDTAVTWRRRRASVKDIEQMDRQEVRCIARDLGISPVEIRTLTAKGENAADLLVRRMKTIGLEPGQVDVAVMRDLQRCCSICTQKGLCIHELEDKPRGATWPKYCPNEQTLIALTDEQSPGGRSKDATVPHRT
jgi:uncharacterized protein YjiS (DUF1127 family)